MTRARGARAARGTRALAAALAVAAAIAPAAARAEPIGLLDVRGDGDVTDVVLARLGEAVEEGLGGSDDLEIVERSQLVARLAESTWTPACTAGPCLTEVAEHAGVAHVLTAAVSASGQTYRFTISLVDTRTGRVLRQTSETCVACTVDDLASSATIATIALMNEAGETIIAADDPRAAALERRVRRHARAARRTGLLLLGAAAVGGGVAAYFVRKDDDVVGYAAGGAAAGLAVSGAVLLGLSLRF